ncbi:hypothetical protein HMPREF0297_1060 [Corynebacterium jeikeium ATCC 43734]|nr:hypothetical protein HMPREF0297_1060 [Corynebacterium jeikeium ATCC 43734]
MPSSGNTSESSDMCHRKIAYDQRPSACIGADSKNRDRGASV